MDVEIVNRTKEKVPRRVISGALKRAGRLIGFPRGTVLSVVFLNKNEMQNLNRQVRFRDEATDVLSFSFVEKLKNENRFVIPEFVRSAAGEIFLCSEMIREKAHRRGESEEQYLRLLLVHSLLHLKGAEHENEGEAEKMEQQEREILAHI